MATQDLKNLVAVDQSILPAAYTATQTGSSSDLQGYQSATVEINAGTWTDGTHVFEVQESDDDSTFTAVADGDLIGSEPTIDAATEDETVHTIGYIGTKRYVRVVATLSGTTTGMEFSVNVIKGHPHTSTATSRA